MVTNMTKMNQRDLFNLIIDLNFAKQVGIKNAILESSDAELDDGAIASCINRAIRNRTGKPLSNTINQISDLEFSKSFFSIIFRDCDVENGASRDIAREKFNEIRNYLLQNQLSFNGGDIAPDSPEGYSTYLIKMICEAFHDHKPHENKVASISSNTPKASLHSQTIFCPSTFFEREQDIIQMEEILTKYKTVVLCGIGGIGKSYLARQYAYAHSNDYSYEQLVTCSVSFSKTFLSMQFDNINDDDMSEKDRIEKRLNLLKDMTDDTLLIIDNVDLRPDDIDLFEELRKDSRIHIIITTRLNDLFPTEQTIFINPMSTENQYRFFLSNYKSTIDEKSNDIIYDILRYIDGHTLLIELVAKTMYANAMSPTDMLKYLTEAKSDTELLPIPYSKDNISTQKEKMDNIVNQLFNIGYLNDDSRCALLYLSLLPLEGISRRLLFNLMPKLKENFSNLISTSWAIEDGNQVRLHPVIRDMVRRNLSPSYKNCNLLLSNIHSQIQMQRDNISQSECEDMCKILTTTFEIPAFYEQCTNITLLSDFADFSYKSYAFDISLKLYQLTALIAEDGPIQTLTNIYLKIGDVQKRLASLSDAVVSYKLALDSNSRQQVGPEKYLQDAEIYLLISDTLRKDGVYDQAMNYNDLAIKIYKDNPSNPLDLAETYNRRGIILLNMSSIRDISNAEKKELLEEALKFYKEGLELRKQNNDNNRQLAYSYHNIGTAYNKLGQYDLARKYHQDALDLRKSCQDLPQTDIASSYVWIGNDYMEQGAIYMDLAKEIFEKALQIREMILGKTHPEVAWSLISLSIWYEKNSDYSNALLYAKKAYDIRKEKYAPTHQYVTSILERIKYLAEK